MTSLHAAATWLQVQAAQAQPGLVFEAIVAETAAMVVLNGDLVATASAVAARRLGRTSPFPMESQAEFRQLRLPVSSLRRNGLAAHPFAHPNILSKTMGRGNGNLTCNKFASTVVEISPPWLLVSYLYSWLSTQQTEYFKNSEQ